MVGVEHHLLATRGKAKAERPPLPGPPAVTPGRAVTPLHTLIILWTPASIQGQKANLEGDKDTQKEGHRKPRSQLVPSDPETVCTKSMRKMRQRPGQERSWERGHKGRAGK